MKILVANQNIFQLIDCRAYFLVKHVVHAFWISNFSTSTRTQICWPMDLHRWVSPLVSCQQI